MEEGRKEECPKSLRAESRREGREAARLQRIRRLRGTEARRALLRQLFVFAMICLSWFLWVLFASSDNVYSSNYWGDHPFSLLVAALVVLGWLSGVRLSIVACRKKAIPDQRNPWLIGAGFLAALVNAGLALVVFGMIGASTAWGF
jgi:hypothetical protein